MMRGLILGTMGDPNPRLSCLGGGGRSRRAGRLLSKKECRQALLVGRKKHLGPFIELETYSLRTLQEKKLR